MKTLDGVGRARQLRQSSTDAEKKLWTLLRRRSLGGWKFRRQEPIGPYVADFVCRRAKLAIEVDGGQHAANRVSEQIRTRFLENQGFRVLRFWNHDVLAKPEGVRTEIAAALEKSKSPPP